MKHDVERDWAGRGSGVHRSGVLLAFGVASAALAIFIYCIACNTLGSVVPEGAVRAWYLPLGLFLGLLRAGARRNTRRPLSLALFLLGLGALSARAYDARGADTQVVSAQGVAAQGADAQGVDAQRIEMAEPELSHF